MVAVFFTSAGQGVPLLTSADGPCSDLGVCTSAAGGGPTQYAACSNPAHPNTPLVCLRNGCGHTSQLRCLQQAGRGRAVRGSMADESARQ